MRKPSHAEHNKIEAVPRITDTATYGINDYFSLFHCYFNTLLTNPGYYDGALLGRERNVAIY